MPKAYPVVGMGSDVFVQKSKRALSQVAGNLTVEDGVIVSDSPDGIVRVAGSTLFTGDCTFDCALHTTTLESREGSITVGNLLVERLIRIKEGELVVQGTLSAPRMEVDRRVQVSGDLTCADNRVGGSLEVGGKTKAERVSVGGRFVGASDAEAQSIDVGGSVEILGTTKAGRVNVGGKFQGKGRVEVDSVNVGGTFSSDSDVKIGDLHVGGSVSIAGGMIDRRAKVGGLMESTGELHFGQICVGGRLQIETGTGRGIDVGGQVATKGDLRFEMLEVGGEAGIGGSATGQRVGIGGGIDVSGNLDLSGELKVGGYAHVVGKAKARSMQVGGRIKAESAVADEEIETTVLLTPDGTRARRIQIGRDGEAQGTLTASQIIIGEKSRVEDLHGGSVEMRRGSRARNIHAKSLDIESDCTITGEVLYTEGLRADRNVGFARKPEKVEKLPE